MATALFVFFGPPGSGKGSLAQLCVQKLGWMQLSTGDLCRKNIAEQTELGKQIDLAIRSGKLISDSLVAQMVVQWFEKHYDADKPVIFDGFPRTLSQAQFFHEFLQKENMLSTMRVVRFQINPECVVARLGGRYTCTNQKCQAIYSLVAGSSLIPQQVGVCDKCGAAVGRRHDDAEDVVRDRLVTYHKHEGAMLDYYKNSGYAVEEFDAEQPLTVVFEEFVRTLASQQQV